jgi:hypothetical protein
MANALVVWTDEAFDSARRARRIVQGLRTVITVIGSLTALWVVAVVVGGIASGGVDALVGVLSAVGVALGTAILLCLLAAVASALELLATQTEHQLIQAEDDERS